VDEKCNSCPPQIAITFFFEMLPPPAGDSELPLYGLLLFFHDNECYINILTEE